MDHWTNQEMFKIMNNFKTRSCVLFLMIGCTPPIVTIQEAQTATVTVISDQYGGDKVDEEIRIAIKEQLSKRLSMHTKVINPSEATPNTVNITIKLIRPVLAEIPPWWDKTLSNMAQGATGHLFDDFYQGFLRLGIVITPEQRTQIEDDPLEWGLAPKTAKRSAIKSLGFTPYIISGKMQITSNKVNRDIGAFFGWSTLKFMKPVQAGGSEADENISIQGSAAGVAAYLLEKKLQ